MTFFFSGGREEPYPGEDRILVPSPKVATYDLQPEMSAPEVTDRIVEAIENQRYDVIVCQLRQRRHGRPYRRIRRGGQSGRDASTCASAAYRRCAGKSRRRSPDHRRPRQRRANVRRIHGQAHTAHTTEPVPFIYVGKRDLKVREGGVLADVAPTMLMLLGLEQPAEMTGYFDTGVSRLSNTATLWERACSRKRRHSQHRC